MEFKLPEGFKAWCHICGDPPFNKKTKIKNAGLGNFIDIEIPGIGFKTLEDLQKHRNEIHDIRKARKNN